MPLLARDGGFVRKGYYPPLDEIKEIKDDSHKLIVELQNKYAKSTGISNLKIKYNNVIGYFIEVQSKFAAEMLENKEFIHRQSVLNASRFTTVELADLENKIRGAADKALAMEIEIFNNLVQDVTIASDDISRTAKRWRSLTSARLCPIWPSKKTTAVRFWTILWSLTWQTGAIRLSKRR